MKKFLIILLTLLLILLPCYGYAAKLGPPNYLDGLTWNKTYSATITQANGLSVSATNITQTYSTPAINIAPAIKQCFYDCNMSAQITIRISGQIKIDFQNTNHTVTTLRFTIRSRTDIKDSEAFKTQYKNSLNGQEPFFNVTGQNALKHISLTHTVRNDWTPILLDVTITKNNAFSELTPDWFFCVDAVNKSYPVRNMHFQDMRLELISSTNVVKTPTPTPSIPPRATPNSLVISTPLPTQAPVVTPKPTASPRPLEETKELFYDQPLIKDVNNIISWAWKGAVIIVIIAGFFNIVLNLFTRKKK